MARHSPDWITVHTARMFIEETTVEGERKMLEVYFPDALRDIASAQPDVVIFGCTSASAVLGAQADRQMMEEIYEVSGAVVVSTNDSIQKELSRSGVKNALVATAYIDELTDRIARGIEESGIKVAKAVGMGIVDPFDIANVEPEEIYSMVSVHAATVDADGVFISCTNLRAMDVRQRLEDDLEIPVITSNQASLAQAMRALDAVFATG